MEAAFQMSHKIKNQWHIWDYAG